jgi:hypothetical protein
LAALRREKKDVREIAGEGLEAEAVELFGVADGSDGADVSDGSDCGGGSVLDQGARRWRSLTEDKPYSPHILR